jgi:outer membrane protein TolC
LYAGNRIKNEEKKSIPEKNIAALEVEKTSNDIHIETIGLFLGIYKLMQTQNLILQQIKEEESRLKEVEALKNHGAVTQNDVLRAQVQLSDMRLALLANQKNTEIVMHDLKTVLQINENDSLVLDTTELITNPALNNTLDFYTNKALQKEDMRIAKEKENILLTDKAITKGAYYPVIALFGTYGLNYPNYKFFPPNPNLYSLGMLGVDVSFSLTNLHTNKKKMQAADLKIKQQEINTEILADEIKDKVFKEYKQYQMIAEKIPVTKQTIEQAEENYRIVKTKYLNQLALITDMVDADNILLQAHLAYITAQTDLQMKYYELLYAAGILDL